MLEEFVDRINDFTELTPAKQIPYFAYYLCRYRDLEYFAAKDIRGCYEELKLPPYSNISSYLSKLCKEKKLIRNKKTGAYSLARKEADEIGSSIGVVKVKEPSMELFPLNLLDNTRTYLINIGRQAILCYDNGIYDASLVMIRKLIESIIIELFTRHNIKDRIQDSKGNFYFCSELIDYLLAENKLWTIGRNTKNALPIIKSKGDMSAHNRRYNAQKSDIDQIKDGLRVTIEELIHVINYDQWNIELKK